MPSVLTKPHRKQRVWATTTKATATLGRGAKRLAKKFATQLSRPAVAKRIGELQLLMALERECKLRQGDVLVELFDGHGVRAIDISRVTGRRHNDLSQQYNTAKMFPPDVRHPDVPYNSYFLAMRMSRKFRRLDLKPTEVLEEILSRGLTQHRDVTRFFAQRARAFENNRALSDIQRTSTTFAVDAAYHARFQSVRAGFGDGTIKILCIDPPYVYAKSSDGRYRSRSARSLECDSSGRDEAISLVVDLLRDWLPTLVSGGVLLLWQPAELLPREIADAIDQYGWEMERLVIWDKIRAQPGAFDSPYSVQCEHLLVLKRKGDALINHDNSPRGDILRFDPVSRPGIAELQEHGFEKPGELCKFLVGKHSFEGELVVDLCGCTGSMSIAAIEMRRRWVYVESSSSNYRIGASRIAERLTKRRAAS